ncbi:hypothetical protein [Micromonospora sp. CPCC 206061]|uniref:hypothetical protein n=1 Tax=Micromonospora sp. CPCC 206061 TaxID=3122410 RepID=UPI002FEEB7B6
MAEGTGDPTRRQEPDALDEQDTGTFEEVNRKREWDPHWAWAFFRAASIRAAIYTAVVVAASGMELRSRYHVSVAAGVTVFAFGEGVIRRLGGFPRRFSHRRFTSACGTFGAVLPPGVPMALGLLACVAMSVLTYATVESVAPDVTLWAGLVPEVLFAGALAGLLVLTVESSLEYLLGGLAGLLASRVAEGRGVILALLVFLLISVGTALVLRRAPDGLLGAEFACGGQLGYLWYLADTAGAADIVSTTGLVNAVLALGTLRVYFALSTLSQPLKFVSVSTMILGLYVLHGPR